MTRSQHYLDQAFRHVEAVRNQTEPGSLHRRTYGGLCHTFPVLVRTSGLCQTLAYVEAKAAPANSDSGRARAYQDLRAHVAEVLGVGGNPLVAVRTAGLDDYLRYTRTILDAWVYYRRFAVSVLEIEAGDLDEAAS